MAPELIATIDKLYLLFLSGDSIVWIEGDINWCSIPVSWIHLDFWFTSWRSFVPVSLSVCDEPVTTLNRVTRIKARIVNTTTITDARPATPCCFHENESMNIRTPARVSIAVTAWAYQFPFFFHCFIRLWLHYPCWPNYLMKTVFSMGAVMTYPPALPKWEGGLLCDVLY